jgi:hypothetical protein
MAFLVLDVLRVIFLLFRDTPFNKNPPRKAGREQLKTQAVVRCHRQIRSKTVASLERKSLVSIANKLLGP